MSDLLAACQLQVASCRSRKWDSGQTHVTVTTYNYTCNNMLIINAVLVNKLKQGNGESVMHNITSGIYLQCGPGL